MIEIERDVYKKLLDWKNKKDTDTLLVEGARQVGKTFIVKKFAKEEFNNYIFIDLSDLSGKRFLDLIKVYSGTETSKNTIIKSLEKYSKDFRDSKDFLVVIDEIQDSYEVYNLIRCFNRELNCRFILTGSYLGRILKDNEFWVPAGDIESIEVLPLTFREFLRAIDLKVFELFNNIDLYGKSSKNDYEYIKSYYKKYLLVGGYPKAVIEYINNMSFSDVYDYYEKVLATFSIESTKYLNGKFYNNLILNSYRVLMDMLLSEKKGFKNNNFSDSANRLNSNLSYNSGSLNFPRKSYTELLDWLVSCKCILSCGKVVECDINNEIPAQRFYFYDIGVLSHLLIKYKRFNSNSIGLLNENYVATVLRNKKMTIDFTTFANYEIDFITNDFKYKYGIEVKTGKEIGTSVKEAYKRNKIDKILYLKGNTYGGVEGDIITIPIYLFERFNFKDNLDNFELLSMF